MQWRDLDKYWRFVLDAVGITDFEVRYLFYYKVKYSRLLEELRENCDSISKKVNLKTRKFHLF